MCYPKADIDLIKDNLDETQKYTALGELSYMQEETVLEIAIERLKSHKYY